MQAPCVKTLRVYVCLQSMVGELCVCVARVANALMWMKTSRTWIWRICLHKRSITAIDFSWLILPSIKTLPTGHWPALSRLLSNRKPRCEIDSARSLSGGLLLFWSKTKPVIEGERSGMSHLIRKCLNYGGEMAFECWNTD